jgi:protein-histidine pros-kinase
MKISGPLSDVQVQQLEWVRSSSRHLLALISDLLDLSRIESGKTQVQREPVSCAEALEETVHELAALAQQKHLELTVAAPETPVVLHTDRRFLRQILTNLVSNAVKFTDQGSIRLSCRQDGDGGPVCITVADTGIGIRAEDLSRLFGEFCRVQSPSGDYREGTGLGLHVSQKLAVLLGGRITVESEFGKGSTFTLTLPAGAAAAE